MDVLRARSNGQVELTCMHPQTYLAELADVTLSLPPTFLSSLSQTTSAFLTERGHEALDLRQRERKGSPQSGLCRVYQPSPIVHCRVW